MKGYVMNDFKKRMEKLKQDEMNRKPGKGEELERPLMQFNQNAKKEIKRERRVTILLTDNEYESLSEQAAVMVINDSIGTTLSDYIRRQLL